MGAGDHHRRDETKDRTLTRVIDPATAAAQQLSEDVSTVTVVDIDDVPTIHPSAASAVAAAEDVWAASEGYTPLSDMPGMEGGMFTDGGSTTFYASFHPGSSSFLTQLASSYRDDDDASLEDDTGTGSLQTAYTQVASPLDDVETPDFRSIADHALMNLDNEYQRTLAFQSRPPETLDTEKQESIFSVNDDAFIAADAVDIVADGSSLPTTYEKVLPDIDAEAVRRAVQSIQLQNPKLKQSLQQWERTQNAQATSRTTCSHSSGSVVPHVHALIPSAPLAAFRKQTPKAMDATANLSRSATIAEALRRLDLLQRHWNVETTLRLHLIGCDAVECSSPERLRVLFGPVVRWIGAAPEAPTHVEIVVVGPNVPTHAATWAPLDLLPTGTGASSQTQWLQSATLQCHVGLYNDWLSVTESPRPDLIVAFNAGIWGYTEWQTTIAWLIQQQRMIPFVVTAYTLAEAEDDEDVIQSVLPSHDHALTRCEWEPESNPFASAKVRETHHAEGRVYRENAAWQCWRF